MDKTTMQDVDLRIDIPHVRQTFNWDCGIACAKMILKLLSKDLTDFDVLCKNLHFGDSVWTIDLAQIMNHYGVRNTLTTITLGVDVGYSKKDFYKERFTADERRISDLFQNAESKGIAVEKRSVPLQEIIDHLNNRKCLIALVDWSYLNCKWCSNTVQCINVPCFGKCLNIYQGHFVVVCGYNSKDQRIYYKNPSFAKEELCCCSMKSFEVARKSYGTDEDLLFIHHSDVSNNESDCADT